VVKGGKEGEERSEALLGMKGESVKGDHPDRSEAQVSAGLNRPNLGLAADWLGVTSWYCIPQLGRQRGNSVLE
jgi:hypothetical protein